MTAHRTDIKSAINKVELSISGGANKENRKERLLSIKLMSMVLRGKLFTCRITSRDAECYEVVLKN